MEVSDPEIPKLFKLTAAVTSVAVILKAIKGVLDKYPNKKAGVTLANTFPSFTFRKHIDGKEHAWDQGVVIGMSGHGVTAISNNSLWSVRNSGVAVSGNGGPMNYKDAANFLALGAINVQFCSRIFHVQERTGNQIIILLRPFETVRNHFGQFLR